MATQLKIGFVGAGKMATALAKGFVRAEIVFPKEIIAGDLFGVARNNFAAETGAKISASNSDVLKFANVLILATKPDQVPAALTEIFGVHKKCSADFRCRRSDHFKIGKSFARRRARHPCHA